MLVVNCSEEFHTSYKKYSKNQQIQGDIRVDKKDKKEDTVPIHLPNSEEAKEADTNKIENFAKEEENEKEKEIKPKDFEEKIKEEKEEVKESVIDTGKYSKHNSLQSYVSNTQTSMMEHIIKKEKETRDNIKFIKRLFEKLVLGTDNLVEVLIKQFSEYKAKTLQKENPEYYEMGLKYLSDKYRNPELKIYFEIKYQDIIYIMCSILKYYTSLTIKLELGKLPTNLMIILYGKEEQYSFLAEMLNYELQLKPYAYKYEIFLEDYLQKQKNVSTLLVDNPEHQDDNNSSKGKSENGEISDQDNINLLIRQIPEIKAIQFEDLNTNIPYMWPPFVKYESGKEIKYRRYEKNDLYHECPMKGNKEEICPNCSKFRNIDKLRLISTAIDKIINMSYLRKSKILELILYRRNYQAYGDSLHFSQIFKHSWNFFNEHQFNYLIQLIKNFYGESISYYFLWLHHFMRWFLFPAAVGIILMILDTCLPLAYKPKRIGKTPITYIDILMMIFCVMMTIWIIMFLKVWKQKEKLYNYIWGTENYTRNEPDIESFQPDYQTTFVFGEKLSIVKPLNRNLKKFVGYLVLFSMGLATCSITFLLFFWKKHYLKDANDFWSQTLITVIFASMNAVQIKLMNILYTFLAKKLNEWENYQKDYQKTRDLTIKLIIFEFINAYFSIFYIGFVKPNINNDPCAGTCIQEIETQLYTTFLINFLLNFVEVGIPFILYKYREWKYKKNIEAKYSSYESQAIIRSIVPHSVVHQMLIDQAENMIYEYNEIIILFGYVCLFSVSAPLTPFLIILLLWMENNGDILKMFFLVRIENLEQSIGIGIYNFLMKILAFIGMITNIGVVLFSKQLKMGDDLFYKITIFLCVENLIMIIIYLMNWNVLPNWFEHLQELKELYDAKYFRRTENNLPHLKFINGDKEDSVNNI